LLIKFGVTSGWFAKLSGNFDLSGLWLLARLLEGPLSAFDFPLRALRLGEKKTLHLPRPNRPGKTSKHYLSQRRKARKGKSKATARMFAASSLDHAKFHGLSTPGAAGVWARRETGIIKAAHRLFADRAGLVQCRHRFVDGSHRVTSIFLAHMSTKSSLF
jgi:hypothetical protein